MSVASAAPRLSKLAAGVVVELRPFQAPEIRHAVEAPTLDWCRRFVGGPVQLYDLPSMDAQLLMHEEGKLVGLPLNRIASGFMHSDLMKRLGRVPQPSELDVVMGPALLLGGAARWT